MNMYLHDKLQSLDQDTEFNPDFYLVLLHKKDIPLKMYTEVAIDIDLPEYFDSW